MFYFTAALAAAQLIYQLVMDGSIDWFYLVILISQLGAIYAEKKEQKKPE